MRSREAPFCPVCGTLLSGYDRRARHVIGASGKVYCDLYRSNTYGVIGEWMPPGNEVVAVFEDGNTTPTEYGYIVASASAGDDTIDGTYTGTVYFKISVEPT